MKIIVQAFVLAAVAFCIAAGGCPTSRLEKRQFNQKLQQFRSPEMDCSAADQLVHIPVPEGYESVWPSVYVVPRCSGHLCSETKRCVATNAKTEEVAVLAMKESQEDCMVVSVEVHDACGCKCVNGPERCVNAQVFDEDSCSCRCPREEKDRCFSEDGRYAFNRAECKCVDLANTVLYGASPRQRERFGM